MSLDYFILFTLCYTFWYVFSMMCAAGMFAGTLKGINLCDPLAWLNNILYKRDLFELMLGIVILSHYVIQKHIRL